MAVRSNARKGSRRKGNNNFLGLIVLSSAIIFAGSMFSQKSHQAEAGIISPPIVAEFDTVEIPVPLAMVPAGTRIRDIRFKRVAYPKHQIPEGAIRDLSAYTESATMTSLPANLPIFASNLSLTAGRGNPVIESIPSGMRAITIRVDATSSVEGWAGSGSVVDVLLVSSEGASVVAEMVKILSAERSTSPVEGASSPTVPSTVTLLVTQEQSLAINAAIPMGKIAFALRNNQDEDNWGRKTFSTDMLKNGSVIRDSQGIIRGYVTVNDDAENSSFALTGNHWIKTEVIPEGFLPSRDR